MSGVTVQVLVSFFVSMLVFMISFSTVWPSYALKVLQSAESPLGYQATISDGNLIGSISMLGSMILVTVAGYVNEKIGPKRAAILSALFVALGWSIIATAKSVTQLVIGRFVVGLGGGLQIVTVILFVGEISQPSTRGLLLPVICFMYSLGTLVSYIEGWFFSYDVVNYSTLTMIVVFIVIAMFLKETPQHLLRCGMEKEALTSLKFYRGTSTTSQEILDELLYLQAQLGTSEIKNSSGSSLQKIKLESEVEKLNEENNKFERKNPEQSPWQILRSSKTSQRAIVILSVHMILAVLMGMIGIQTYAGQLFKRAAPDISPDLCSVILAIVLSISSAAAIFITDLFSRRFLMIASCVSSAIFMALLASMLRWSWAPELGIPLTIVLFCIFFQLGAINVPFVQIPECLIPQLQSFGSTFTMCCMFLANFTVLYLFEPTVSLVGLDGIFFLFSLISLLTAVVSYLFMRETRKVPLEVVQEMFEHGYLYRSK